MNHVRYLWDKAKLRLPIFGKIIVKGTIARFCRSFATASKSDVPIVQAFQLVSRVVGNAFYEEPILLAVMGVLVGILLLGIFMPLWSLGQATLHGGR